MLPTLTEFVPVDQACLSLSRGEGMHWTWPQGQPFVWSESGVSTRFRQASQQYASPGGTAQVQALLAHR